MLVCLNSLNGLFCVCRCNGGYYNGLKARVLEHLVVVEVNSGSRQRGRRPRLLLGIRGESSDEIGARSAVGEVQGVAGTHAAEASTGDFELALGHFPLLHLDRDGGSGGGC